MKNKIVYRFKIELQNISPAIWRRIEVPSSYSFWDLHVAIQDAMGWLDYHLHAFRGVPKGKKKPIFIGIPDQFDDGTTLPGWETPITALFVEPGVEVEYEYDFGDGWCHQVLLEGILLAEPKKKYPCCHAGERACPPEDCGGFPGYENLLEVLGDEEHEEYPDMIYWLRHHAKNYHPYDPEKFEPEYVKFSNPTQRWKKAFAED